MDARHQLERAFPSKPIDPASAFEEWGGYLDASLFRDGVRGKRWPELEAGFLERHHDAIVFFGPSAFVTYLPAYLATMVRRAPALDMLPLFVPAVLTRSLGAARFDARFAPFTDDQRRAVASVLEGFEQALEGTSLQADIRAALDAYWRDQLRETR